MERIFTNHDAFLKKRHDSSKRVQKEVFSINCTKNIGIMYNINYIYVSWFFYILSAYIFVVNIYYYQDISLLSGLSIFLTPWRPDKIWSVQKTRSTTRARGRLNFGPSQKCGQSRQQGDICIIMIFPKKITMVNIKIINLYVKKYIKIHKKFYIIFHMYPWYPI